MGPLLHVSLWVWALWPYLLGVVGAALLVGLAFWLRKGKTNDE